MLEAEPQIQELVRHECPPAAQFEIRCPNRDFTRRFE